MSLQEEASANRPRMAVTVERTARFLAVLVLLPMVACLAALIALQAALHWRSSETGKSASLKPDR
jgi:hypothetical protein